MVETALKGSELSSIQKFPSIEQVFVFQSNRNLIEKVELTPRLLSIIEFGDFILPKLPTDDVDY
jgi:hypothetical protein